MVEEGGGREEREGRVGREFERVRRARRRRWVWRWGSCARERRGRVVWGGSMG